MSDDPQDAVDPLAAWSATDMRVGRIVEAEAFPEGRYSTHLLRIDLGPELGTRKSLARLVPHYAPEDLVGRQVVIVANLEPAKLMGVESQGMVLAATVDGRPVLLRPDEEVPDGSQVR